MLTEMRFHIYCHTYYQRWRAEPINNTLFLILGPRKIAKNLQSLQSNIVLQGMDEPPSQ